MIMKPPSTNQIRISPETRAKLLNISDRMRLAEVIDLAADAWAMLTDRQRLQLTARRIGVAGRGDADAGSRPRAA